MTEFVHEHVILYNKFVFVIQTKRSLVQVCCHHMYNYWMSGASLTKLGLSVCMGAGILLNDDCSDILSP